MDRREFKSKPQHLVVDSRSGELKKVVVPSDVDVGAEASRANARVFGTVTADGLSVTTLEATDISADAVIASTVDAGAVSATSIDADAVTTRNLGALANASVFGCRLSLSSSVSLTTNDIVSGSTLYLVPHTSNTLGVFDGVDWRIKQVTSASFPISGLTANQNYDVFVNWDAAAGVVALTLDAWASDSARSTTLGSQDGVLVKASDATKRYAGSIRTVATNAVPDSEQKRFVWNQYNRSPRRLYVTDTTVSWTYSVANTWRQVRGSTANKAEFLCGDVSFVEATAISMIACTVAAHVRPGIGLDVTNTNNAQVTIGFINSTETSLGHAHYRDNVALGYHALNWLEFTDGGTASFFGFSSVRAPGMVGTVVV